MHLFSSLERSKDQLLRYMIAKEAESSHEKSRVTIRKSAKSGDRPESDSRKAIPLDPDCRNSGTRNPASR